MKTYCINFQILNLLLIYFWIKIIIVCFNKNIFKKLINNKIQNPNINLQKMIHNWKISRLKTLIYLQKINLFQAITKLNLIHKTKLQTMIKQEVFKIKTYLILENKKLLVRH